MSNVIITKQKKKDNYLITINKQRLFYKRSVKYMSNLYFRTLYYEKKGKQNSNLFLC